LVFLRGSTLLQLCGTEDETTTILQRPQFGMHRFDWPGGGIEFHLPTGAMLDVLRTNGFQLERLIEVQAPPDASTHDYYSYVSAEWAKQWPSEEIWVCRLTG
jgi:hypothetical protein